MVDFVNKHHSSKKTRSFATLDLAPTINKSTKFSKFSLLIVAWCRWPFRSFFTSPIFAVVIDQENQKTFLLHFELLAHESNRLAKNVKNEFDEQSIKRILLDEENPELFDYFVKYLYRTKWLTKKGFLRDSNYIIIARLYALEERLQTHKFQYVILRKFISFFTNYTSLSNQDVCDFLKIICTKLSNKINEDSLKDQIFWYVASRFTQFQKYDYFLRFLKMHKNLKKYLCIRVENNFISQSKKSSESLSLRFRPKSIYQVWGVIFRHFKNYTAVHDFWARIRIHNSFVFACDIISHEL